MEIYWQLFCAFFRIGGLTFGGGLAQLPMLKFELVQKYHWLDEPELLDIYAIGQCTPGIIAINTATYVGYKKAGVPGGIVATIGMVTPSLVIITLVAAALQSVIDNVWVQHAIMGIRGVVCALMLNTVLTMGKKSLKSKFAVAVAIPALIAAFFFNVTTLVIVIFAAVFGIIWHVALHDGKMTAAKEAAGSGDGGAGNAGGDERKGGNA
ncbi:MAG: chromate transporter [Lachnospiraceae bacterium]|nr:chromate transporter [Lachnospiraceae bacterium]